MSWKPEVQADATTTWYSNALRFSTKQEAEEYVTDLAMRWTLVRGTRVVESTDAVTHAYADGVLETLR